MPDHTNSIYTLTGRITNLKDKPLEGLIVRAYDLDPKTPPNPLGKEAITAADGHYEIIFKEEDFKRGGVESGGPDVFIRVYNQEGCLLKESPFRKNCGMQITIDLKIIDDPTTKRQIEGLIVLNQGTPAENLTLRLYRRTYDNKPELLAETTTGEGGRYSLPYNLGGTVSSLEIWAVDKNGKEFSLSKPLNYLVQEETQIINLGVPKDLPLLEEAEYKRLMDDLKQHVKKSLASLREDDKNQDVTELNRATGWDARLIALAVIAARLSADSDVQLPQEGLYGLFRAGLPSEKLLLAQVGEDVIEKVLNKMATDGIIKKDFDIGQFKKKFAAFANKVRLAMPAPGSRSTYEALLKTSTLQADDQEKFVSIYLNHRGDAAHLWKKAREAGLTDAQISTLQRQGKLAFLVGNSAGMLDCLMNKQIDDPVQLIEHGLYSADAWEQEVYEQAGIPVNRRNKLNKADEKKLDELIPTAYAAENVLDRLHTYAKDMARKVRLSYPTQLIGHIIDKDTTDPFKLGSGRSATATLLKNAASQGFRLGQTPVETYMKTHVGVRNGLSNIEFESAKKELKKLQRVYQITPSNEAMPVLIDLGMTSAYDVMAYSETEFIKRYEKAYIDRYNKPAQKTESEMIYRKAQQVSCVTYNIFTIAKQLDSNVSLSVTGAPIKVRESVRNELIKQFPTMESLFGSMDFCECEHCRSVLSPAAYLVDLLQSLEEWGKTRCPVGSQKPYDVLIERRPDIPHIHLSCENTHTALPYIDIVNEILEYYVANGKLEEKAAHDTGDATTAELLAEPQNVIREAYDKLREANYPLNLPFDLWLETMRQFCNYFETPLDQLLETFRSGDGLFELIEPNKIYNRVAIFMESLGLSPAEVAIFTNTDPLKEWYKLYGFTTANEATTEAIDATTGQRIDLNSAKALSRRLGVTYKEIAEIIQTAFVNPKLEKLVILYKLGASICDARFYLNHKGLLGKNPDTLSIEEQKIQLEVQAFQQKLDQLAKRYNVDTPMLEDELQAIPSSEILVLADPDTGCNFDLKTLQYADGTKAKSIDFLRINLFVRLWKKLGWSIEETDRALTTFIPQSAPFDDDLVKLAKQPFKTALIYLAHLKALDDKIKVGKESRLKLLTLWSDIATTGKKPLYAQLFLTRSVLKNDIIFDHQLGKYLQYFDTTDKIYKPFRWDRNQPEDPKTGNVSLKTHLLALQGALSLTEKEISQILEDNGMSLDSAELSLPKISLLYRYGLLAKALKLSVRDLISLKQLSGLDPFKALNAAPLKYLAEDYPFTQTLRFIEIAAEVKDSGLKIEDLNYLLRHYFDETGKYRQNREKTMTLLRTLSQGIRAIRLEHAVPDDPGALTEEVLRQKLGLILPPDVVELFLAMMNGTAEFTATKTGVGSGNKLDPKTFEDEPAIRQINYNATRNEQTLTYRGALFDDQKLQLKIKFDQKLSDDQKAVFADLLDKVQQQEQLFFQKYLQKQAAGTQPVSGFLDSADYELMFKPMSTGLTEKEQQDHLRQQRTRLAQVFLPYLQHRLIRQFIVQTLTAYTGADPVLVESLVTDKRLLATVDSLPLMTAFAKTSEHVLPVMAAYWFSKDQSGVVLTTQFDFNDATSPEGIVINPIRTTDTNRADLSGYLEVPENRDYKFSVVLANKDDEVDLHIGDLVNSLIKGKATQNGDKFDAQITLEKGRRYQVQLVVKGVGASEASMMVDSVTLLKETYNTCRLGYIEVPTSGGYRFYIELDKKDATAKLRFNNLTNPMFLPGEELNDNATFSTFLELKAGILYSFSLELKNLNGGAARLLVQGETLPKGPISQLTIYPLSVIDGAESALLLLTKVLQIVQSLGLSEREIRYLLTHAANFDNLNLSQLPTRSNGNTLNEAQNLFKQFLRMADYARLKHDLAAGTDDLIGILEANATTDSDKLEKQVYPLIAKLTRRDDATVKTAAEALFAAPSFDSEQPLKRLWGALQVIERFGVPVTSLQEWTRILSTSLAPEQRFKIAQDLKEAVKARFDPEAWQRVAQPIFDKLRQRQRDALVAHIMHQLNFDRVEQLYEYFLIDPGMEPVVQTSRIRLAIGSVQLFIQRCLLNLEPKVNASTINSKHWEWMKRYRVWEANRKIFLFPENWLEPEFRDDKTHLFTELEGSLLQGDVSSDLVEDAFLKYLKKLEELARLDIVAMHIEDKPDPRQNTLHVIGRTFSQPHKYFYRRYAYQMWTPWEPVSAEIEGDHLAPVVWRDRLYLFWVTFMEKPNDEGKPKSSNKSSNDKPSEMTLSTLVDNVKEINTCKKIEAHLHWSEYIQGEWSTRESGELSTSIKATVLSNYDCKNVFIHVSKAFDAATGEEGGVYIHLGGDINKAFFLAGRNSTPEKKDNKDNSPRGDRPEKLFSGKDYATRYSSEDALSVGVKQRITTGTDKKTNIDNRKILKQVRKYLLLPCNNNMEKLGVSKEAYQNATDPDAVKAAIELGLWDIASLMKPVFYQDNENIFFVEPKVTERTIEEWQEWIVRTPTDWVIVDGSLSDHIVVVPQTPSKWPLPNHEEIGNVPIDPSSIYKPKPKPDWLVNPITGLLFDEVLLGPAGQPGVEIQTPGAAAGIGEGGTIVNVNAGSSLASGTTLVLTGATNLEHTGLTQAAGGLNVVGGAGCNSALAQNVNEWNRSVSQMGQAGR